MELEFCQNVFHVRGNLHNSWLVRLSTEASPAMDMYEERPPEIFTGGYFDQATIMGGTFRVSHQCWHLYIPRHVCFPLYKSLLQHRVAFNSVQANIVNQTEGLQDFRHRNAFVRRVNDDCTSLHAHHKACTYSTNLQMWIFVNRFLKQYTIAYLSTCFTSVCSCVLQVAGPGEDKKDIW